MYPEVKEKIEEIVMMVGSIFPGNTNSVAEFNIYNDPHVAAIVFQSGVKINMLGLDVTEKTLLHRENILKMRDSGKTGTVSDGRKICRGGNRRNRSRCTGNGYLDGNP